MKDDSTERQEPKQPPEKLRFLGHSLTAFGHDSAASVTGSIKGRGGMKCEKRLKGCRFSIGSAPLTSITKSDAQISGGETRQDLKIPGVSPRWLPLALSCSRPAVYVLWWKPYLNHHVPLRLDSSLQAGLYARTPRSARLPRPFR